MPVISTNIAANSAVRYLNINSADQTSSLSKLASGSRISQASDDAAGLAISTRISSDVTALTQAATNASHGISVLQTADGGASNISDILQRMKALASQSASGTVTDTERAYIDAEFSQLVDEIDGISTGTRYNGQSLLDGTSAFANTGVTVMVGSNANDTIKVTLDTLTAAGLKLTTTDGATSAGTDGTGTSGKSTGSTDLSAGITLTAAESFEVSIDGEAFTVNLSMTGSTAGDENYTAQDVLDAVNTAIGAAGSATLDASGNLQVTSATDGAQSKVTMTSLSIGNSVVGTSTAVNGLATATTATAGSSVADIEVETAGADFSGGAETLTVSVDGKDFSIEFLDDGGDGAGAYTGAEVLTTINNVLGDAGTASFDAAGRLQITSATTGANSSVSMTGAASLVGTETAIDGEGATAPANVTSSLSASGFTVKGNDVSFDVTTGVDAKGENITSKVTLTRDGGSNADGAYSLEDIAAAINTALGATSTAKAAVTDGALTLSNTATGKNAEITVDNFVGTDFTAASLGFTDNIDPEVLSVSSQDDANAAIAVIDAAIDVVSRARANIGALESRFSFRSDSISTSIENLQAANSAITDTDVASESAKLASAKVKTQAAVAAATQASQMPQDLLKLLQ